MNMEITERRPLVRIVAARQQPSEEILATEQKPSGAALALDPAKGPAVVRADKAPPHGAEAGEAPRLVGQSDAGFSPGGDAANWRKMSLRELYTTHDGKVSDKWSLYLTEYDRLFAPYRDRPIRILEIGTQNGGSLELWSKYFAKAKKVVGCDINQDCARLRYDDPRISVVIGNANVERTRKQILRACDSFDIIIDDGSHQSSDVICSFAKYFPHLNDGGLYVVEDLHCSYWKEFAGGLFNPASSIGFFKLLVDVVHREHWGIDKARSELLHKFEERYGVNFLEGALRKVHSLEFANSLCFIRKQDDQTNLLGPRIVAGRADVISPLRASNGMSCLQFDQRDSKWSSQTIDHEMLLRAEILGAEIGAEREHETSQKMAADDRALGEARGQLAQIQGASAARERELQSQLDAASQKMAAAEGALAELREQLAQTQAASAVRERELQSQLDAASQKMAADEGALAELREQLNQAQTASAARERELQSQLEAASQKMAAAERALAELSGQLTLTETGSAAREREVQRQLDAASQKMVAAERALAETEAGSAARERELQRQVEATEAGSAARERELQRQVEAASQKMATNERALAEAREQLALIEAASTARERELQSQLDTASQKMAADERALTEARTQRAQAEARLNERFGEIATLTQLLHQTESVAEWMRQIASVLLGGRSRRGRLAWFLPGPAAHALRKIQLKRRGLFDAAAYFKANSDVARSGADPLRHYVDFGIKEGRRRG
jgi:cephalosporin hydroxylase